MKRVNTLHGVLLAFSNKDLSHDLRLAGACHQKQGFSRTIDERKGKRDPISIQLLDPIRDHHAGRLCHGGRSRKQGSCMTFVAHPEQDQIKARKLSWLQFPGLKFKEFPDHSFVLFGCFRRAQLGRHTEYVGCRRRGPGEQNFVTMR